MFFAENLKYLRSQQGKTLTEIVAGIDFSSSQWNNWELGNAFPKFLDLVTISKHFGISETDLIHSELWKGNLIGNLQDTGIEQKGNLKGNPTGNLNTSLELKEPVINYERNLGLPKVITLDSNTRENIVHVPIKARAGYLLGYGDPKYIEKLNSYSIPGLRDGTFRSFEAEGHSMDPTIKNKDIVIGRYVESMDYIRENRVHIVVTKHDGVLIKRVLNRLDQRNKIYLKSDNIKNRSEYPIIALEPQDISELWYGTIKFGTDFTEPGEYYTRLNDLEIKMMEVMKTLEIK